MRNIARRRYGAILWRASVDMDEAIRIVKRFDDPQAAIRLLADRCAAGEQWAVVDLSTMGVVATGSAP
jgi:hypothetical protein